MIGISGWGKQHVRRLLELEQEGAVEFACFAELPSDRTASAIDDLKAQGKVHFANYHDMLYERLDAVVISTPIHLHKEMALACFKQGVHVYLEKPPVVLIGHLEELLDAQRKFGVSCQVGFQHASSPSVRRVIEHWREGRLGACTGMSAVGRLRRADSYYTSSRWKGAIEVDGEPVLDGSVMNPLSHLLHISLYFAEELQSGKLKTVRAELYRGHPFISSEDTSCARIGFADWELGFYTTTCSPAEYASYVVMQFERGTLYWGYDAYYIVEHGRPIVGPFRAESGDLLGNFIRHLQMGEPLHMPLRRCESFVKAANAMFASSGSIRTVPEKYMHVIRGAETYRSILGIAHLMEMAAERRLLFSEMQLPWAVPPQRIVDAQNLLFDWKKIVI